VTIEITLKLLIRCKLMLSVRKQLLVIFNMIDRREQILKELNYIVVQGDRGGRFNINQALNNNPNMIGLTEDS